MRYAQAFGGDKKSVWWILGGAAGLIALFIAFVAVPSMTPIKSEGVEVDVPRMENVPPPAAGRMKLASEKAE